MRPSEFQASTYCADSKIDDTLEKICGRVHLEPPTTHLHRSMQFAYFSNSFLDTSSLLM